MFTDLVIEKNQEVHVTKTRMENIKLEKDAIISNLKKEIELLRREINKLKKERDGCSSKTKIITIEVNVGGQTDEELSPADESKTQEAAVEEKVDDTQGAYSFRAEDGSTTTIKFK